VVTWVAVAVALFIMPNRKGVFWEFRPTGTVTDPNNFLASQKCPIFSMHFSSVFRIYCAFGHFLMSMLSSSS